MIDRVSKSTSVRVPPHRRRKKETIMARKKKSKIQVVHFHTADKTLCSASATTSDPTYSIVAITQVMDTILRKQPVAFFDGCEGGVFALDDSADGYRHACVSVRGTCRALGLSMETMPMNSLACALYVVWSGQRWRLADDEGMDFDPPREFTSGRVDRRLEW